MDRKIFLNVKTHLSTLQLKFKIFICALFCKVLFKRDKVLKFSNF